MTNQMQHNQAYLHWYLGQGPQRTLDELEIRSQDIVPMPKRTVFTNPWVFNGMGNSYWRHSGAAARSVSVTQVN